MYQEKKMTHEEMVEMYDGLEKSKLIEMLIESNKVLSSAKKYMFSSLKNYYSSKPKPCPFCGNAASVVSDQFGDNATEIYAVACNGMDSHRLDEWFDTRDDAVQSWNKRC